MADKRAFAAFDVGYLDNPKLVAMLDALPRAVLMHCKSVLYASQHLTDGHVAPGVIRRHIGGTEEDVEALVERGLWHRKGHNCGECPQPSELEVYVHDYLQHNRSKDDYNRLARRGKKAAEARWGNATSTPTSNATSTAKSNAGSNAQNSTEQNSSGGRGSARRHKLTDDFEASEAHRKKADDLGLNLEAELEKFKNHFIGNGDTKADWSRTFHNWLTNSLTFSRGRPSPPRPQTGFDPWAGDWSEDDFRK